MWVLRTVNAFQLVIIFVFAECIEDLRLLLLTWSLHRGGRLLGTYVPVFDLNQWYRALMPGKYR